MLYCYRPMVIEVPHFASLRGDEREIAVLRSDNGQTWSEHKLKTTDDALQEILDAYFEGKCAMPILPMTVGHHYQYISV